MKVAKYIDHTNLKPEAMQTDIDTLVAEARQYKFAAVCVHPCWVAYAVQALKGSGVHVCTVVGFPLGANTMSTKFGEAMEAIENGAKEIDMVINIGRLKAKDYKYIEAELMGMTAICEDRALLKVIIETSLLNKEEKKIVARLIKEAGADYIKTSTGFSTAGANVDDILLLRRAVGPDMGIKASGGIRNKSQMMDLISAGATRIGTSAGVKLVK